MTSPSIRSLVRQALFELEHPKMDGSHIVEARELLAEALAYLRAGEEK